MPEELTPDYAESAKRVVDGSVPSFIDAIPFDDFRELEKPEADEATKDAVAVRLAELPEELQSPNYDDPKARSEDKWTLSRHDDVNGTVIVNLETRDPGYGLRRTTVHLKPDLSLGVWTHQGVGTRPVPLSQPLAEALLEILPKNNTSSPETYEKVSPER
jgi:hypothetical protein